MHLGGAAGGHQDDLFEIGHRFCFLGIRTFEAFHGGHGGQFLLDSPGGTYDIELAFECPLEQLINHEQSVDLVGTFINPVDPAVAVGAGGGVLLAVADTAVDLYIFVHTVIGHFRAKHLQDRALYSILFCSFQHGLSVTASGCCLGILFILHELGSAVGSTFGGEVADGHFGQFMFDSAEVTD